MRIIEGREREIVNIKSFLMHFLRANLELEIKMVLRKYSQIELLQVYHIAYIQLHKK